METGLVFYWISWVGWILVTFFLRKNKFRNITAYWILLTIISANMYITIANFDVSILLILYLIPLFIMLARRKKWFYHLLAVITIMIGSNAILLWETNIPIWYFYPKLLFGSILTAIIILLLTNNFIDQCIIGALGMICGEFLYVFVLASYQLKYSVGDFGFLDRLMMVFVIICVGHLLKKLAVKWLASPEDLEIQVH